MEYEKATVNESIKFVAQIIKEKHNIMAFWCIIFMVRRKGDDKTKWK